MKTPKGFSADHADSFRLWETKDGKSVRWGDMDLNHLSNCYHMLVRNAQNARTDYVVKHCMIHLGLADTSIPRAMPKKGIKEIADQQYSMHMSKAKRMRDYIKWRVETKGK